VKIQKFQIVTYKMSCEKTHPPTYSPTDVINKQCFLWQFEYGSHLLIYLWSYIWFCDHFYD